MLEKIGEIGVDTGMVWIGDPCYVLHKTPPAALGKDWGEFCDMLPKDYPTRKSFKYDLGHEGLGVVASSGCGDGVYPVFAEIKDVPGWGKRVTRLIVDFFPEDGDALRPLDQDAPEAQEEEGGDK